MRVGRRGPVTNRGVLPAVQQYPIDVTDNKYIVDATRCPTTLITEADKRHTRFGPAETLEECLVEADGREAVASCLSDNSLA